MSSHMATQTYHSHPSAQASSSSMTGPRPQSRQALAHFPPFPSMTQPEIYVQAIHAFDPANLASTSAAAASNLYLCFKAGEIIRVWSTDEKGWWDGEVTRDMGDKGEKGPRRGWFPSNYVKPYELKPIPDQAGNVRPVSNSSNAHSMSRQASAASIMTFQMHQTHLSEMSHRSRPSTSASHYPRIHNSVPSFSSLPVTYQRILHPVTQSLRLLTNSIASNHTSHFQPSTAVVISAIRTSLEQTDCLSKTSPTLERHPQLAKERKVVLVELSKLVACARAASGVDVPDHQIIQDGLELEVLGQTADNVLKAVLKVMGMAADLGVEARPDLGEADETVKILSGDQAPVKSRPSMSRRSSSAKSEQPGSRRTSRTVSPAPATEEEERTARWSASVRSPPPSNPRMQDTFRHRSSSSVDLRKRRDTSPPPPLPTTSSIRTNHSSSSRSGTSENGFGGPLSSARTRSSTDSANSPISGWPRHCTNGSSATHMSRVQGSIDSSISHNTYSSDGLATPNHYTLPASVSSYGHLQPTDLETVDDMLFAINKAEDALYSLIAAFIGQIHSHSPTAHPSAHAGLVEMTKRTIDAIRDILTVTETLGRSFSAPGVEDKENEVERLKEAKDGMYDLASRLVDAAEILADAPFRLAEQLGGLEPGVERERMVQQVMSDYERDREDLIRIASEGLKHGSQCAGVVRYCLQPGSQTPGRLKAATPRQKGRTPRVEVHLNSDDEADSTEETRRREVVGVRGVHTLSGLHRRVESLGKGREGWVMGEGGMLGVPFGYDQAGGNKDHLEDAEEEPTGDGEVEEVVNEGKEEDLTMRQVGLGYGLTVPGRPPLSHVHSSPLLSTPHRSPNPSPNPNELTPMPGPSNRSRSRSSSLSSPAPPRFGHRSPSRSADLDKFTSDLGGQLGPALFPSRSTSAASNREDGTPYTSDHSTVDLHSRNSVYTMASFNTSHSNSNLSLMSSDLARFSGISAPEQASPQTPMMGQDDSPLLGYLRAEASLNGSNFPRLGDLRLEDSGPAIDLEKTPMRPVRPVPHRYPTSPIPQPTPAAGVLYHIAKHDYDPWEINFNSEGVMVAASLKVLVEKMTPHDGPVDPAFAGIFWDTFRLFTTADALVDETIRRYACEPPAHLGPLDKMNERERSLWVESKVIPTRLRCCNFLKVWLEAEWRKIDGRETGVLEKLKDWNDARGGEGMPAMALRLGRLIKQRMEEQEGGSSKRPTSRASSRSSIRSSGPLSAQLYKDPEGHKKRESGPAGLSISSLRGLRRSASFDRVRQATLSTSSLISSNHSNGNPAINSPTSPLRSTNMGLPPTPIISKSLHSLIQKSNNYKPPPPPGTSVTTTGLIAADTAENPFFPASPPRPSLGAPSVPLTEFEPLELARQLTVMESTLFRQLDPVDLLLSGRKAAKGDSGEKYQVYELKQLSTLSNHITGFVADGVLGEGDTKKRAGLLKFWIKVAERCLLLQNFSSLFAILAGLNSSTILRLKKTWDALSQKYKVLMERLNGVIEHTRNHLVYRAKLKEAKGAVLPFLGLILTDVTFTFDGNPNLRPSSLQEGLMLINVDKYVKLGKIASDFRQYHEPFNFHEIEAVQAYLRRALAERGSASLDSLYRKSLMLEPRKGTEKINSGIDRPGWLGGKV